MRDFSDLSFIDDLTYDIEHSVRIGYTGPRTSRISPNHLSAIRKITPTSLELERELGLGRKIGPFLTPHKFCRIADGRYSQKALESR